MIRLATTADAAAIARIYDPIVAGTAISFETDPPGPIEMERRVRATLEMTPWLVEESEGSVQGYAYASKHRERAAYRWSVDVAVYVHGDRRRTGIGRSSTRRCSPCSGCRASTPRTPASRCDAG